jgi:hypothetical protein
LKPLELLRRAAGKSPGYLARRALLATRRRIHSRAFRRRLGSLNGAALAGEAGVTALAQLWRRHGGHPYRLETGEREDLRRLYAGPYLAERDVLRGQVERILSHEFDLLGSGPTALGSEIDWHCDFKSGRRWSLVPAQGIDYAELGQPSDVKVAWELSRCQHLTTLGRAWVVNRDTRCVEEFQRQVRSWIRANPVGLGVNWASTMDVALRAVSWIWALGLFDDAPLAPDFLQEALFSLYQHGLWIPEHLEIGEVNGNHFLSDAVGLAACGAVFRETREGRRWLEQGQELLEREILEQTEEDGIDIEASVPYHRLVLELFLVGARFLEGAGLEPSARYSERLRRMFGFVYAYTTPEGLSPVIGDADDGRALALGNTDIRDHRYMLSTGAALFRDPTWKGRAGSFWEDSLWLLGPRARDVFEALGTRTEEATQAFPQGGFYVLRCAHQYLFVDAGGVGFRGLGGHGHNDCLAFEWHALGRPLLTDSGAYVYTPSVQWRNRFRSTEFHSTIRVDGEEINRFPSPLALWSLRDDARPFGVDLRPGSDEDVLTAAHTGYRRLADPVTVRRTLRFSRREARLVVTDEIEGRREHLVEFFFHAAPGARALSLGEAVATLRWEDGVGVRIEQTRGPAVGWQARSGWFSPSYGVKMERPFWAASIRATLPLSVEWELSVEREASGG